MPLLNPAREIKNQSSANSIVQIEKAFQGKIIDSPCSPLASQNQTIIQTSINPFTPTHPYSFNGICQNISDFPKNTYSNDTKSENLDQNIESNQNIESRRLTIRQFNVSRYC